MKTTPSFLLLSLLVVISFSCSKESQDLTSPPLPEIDVHEIDQSVGICTELYDESHSRAFGQKNLVWNKNKLRVRFLGGSNYVQNKVRQYAIQWSKHANMTFEFVTSEPSDLRISFDQNDGSWSYVGRSNAYVSPTRATMNFGWFNDRTSDAEIRRTTLHEFGHALGLSHEHQHPQVNINWNTEAVYAYYQRTQGWSRSEVNTNVFQKYSTASSNYSTYDPQSIMHYYIPPSLVFGNWSPTWNTNLSTNDIRFIGAIYPLDGSTDSGNTDDCNCPGILNIIACEDFESYDQSSYAGSNQWGVWSASAGRGELQTYSWGKVLKIAHASFANPDVLFKPGILNSGIYSIKWKLYVAPGGTAYFNIQKYEEPGREFGAQFHFDQEQGGRISVNNREATFTYLQDQWINLELDFDFDQNLVSLQLDNQSIATWPANWTATGNSGTAQFGALNFYAINEDAKFWLDDFCVGQTEINNQSLSSAGNFEEAPLANSEHPLKN